MKTVGFPGLKHLNGILKFGIDCFFLSWTYDESAISLQNKSSSAQVDSYTKNGEWLLKGDIIYLLPYLNKKLI